MLTSEPPRTYTIMPVSPEDVIGAIENPSPEGAGFPDSSGEFSLGNDSWRFVPVPDYINNLIQNKVEAVEDASPWSQINSISKNTIYVLLLIGGLFLFKELRK